MALLLGFSAVDTERAILESRRAIRRLTEAGVTPPSWLMLVGRARLEHAWLSTDPFGDQDFVVGRFSYLGEHAHDAAVLVDHDIDDSCRALRRDALMQAPPALTTAR